MTRVLAASIFAIAVSFGATAQACVEFVKHEPAQLAELEETFLESSSVLAKIAAFEQLACSEISGVRAEVVRIALAPENLGTGLRVSAFQRLVFAKKSFTVTPFNDGSDLDETQLKLIASAPPKQYTVAFSNPKGGCLSTYFQHKTECRAGSQITVDGLTLNVDGGAVEYGSFTLNDENELVGFFVTNRGRTKLPARINLF